MVVSWANAQRWRWPLVRHALRDVVVERLGQAEAAALPDRRVEEDNGRAAHVGECVVRTPAHQAEL